MASYLNFPFDAELFAYTWETERDNTKTRLVESGAMVEDGYIADLISNGSDTYTAPFYKVLGGDPENYDGATNITTDAPTGDSQSGIVFGRAHGWTAKDFVADFNSGADPLMAITSQVNRYWKKQQQKETLGILGAIMGLTAMGDHVNNIASADTTVAEANVLSYGAIADAAQAAMGDNEGEFACAIMHSAVAKNLRKEGILEYAKYTNERGIEVPLTSVAYVNGLLILVDDGVPTTAKGAKAATYTTYLLGNGVLRQAYAPVEVPAEFERDAKTNGGQTSLITRVRQTVHPNGFSFTKPSSGYTASPTLAQLSSKNNWGLKVDHKGIAIASVVSNG